MLTLHGRYVVTLVMAMTASFGPMLDSLKGLADPNAVAAMLASAVAMYLLLLLIPEPISKLISLGLTGALIGYLGLDMFWSLVYGWKALAKAVDVATDFSQLRAAAVDFGKVLGPQMGQLLVLLVCHSLGKGLAARGTVAAPPRFAQANAQAQRLLRVRQSAATVVRSVTLGSGTITLSLASSAVVVSGPSHQAPAGDGHPGTDSWANPSTLEDHFLRHGGDFGAKSPEDYARMASELLRRARAERLPTKIDAQGVIRVYDPSTNTFGSYNPNGTTRTFYKPNPATHGYPTNLDYWNAQPGSLL